MKERLIPIIVVLFFGFIGLVSSGSTSHNVAWTAHLMFNAEFTLRVIGSAAAVMGLIGVLWQWTGKASVLQMAPSAVVILAGIVVSSQFWATALSLAAVIVAALLWRAKSKDADETIVEPLPVAPPTQP